MFKVYILLGKEIWQLIGKYIPIQSHSDYAMGDTTQLTKATSKSDSLRTTVPAGIVKQFGMKEGDALDWTIDIKGSKLIIEISHVKQERIPVSDKTKKGPNYRPIDTPKD